MRYESEPYEGPDIVVLWAKTPRARKLHLCDACNGKISVGTVYDSRGWIEDGEFKFEKTHRWAYQHPSGCPRFAERNRAAISTEGKWVG